MLSSSLERAVAREELRALLQGSTNASMSRFIVACTSSRAVGAPGLACVTQPPGFVSRTSPDLGLFGPGAFRYYGKSAALARGCEGSRRRDGSPGSQEPDRRSPGRVHLSPRTV